MLIDLAFFPLLPDSVPSKWKNGVVVSEMPKTLLILNMAISLAMVSVIVLFFSSRVLKGWNQTWFNVYPKAIRDLAFSFNSFMFNEKFSENDFDKFYEFAGIKFIKILGVLFLILQAFLEVVIYSEIAFKLGLFGSLANMLFLSLIVIGVSLGTYFVLARNHSKFAFLAEG